MLNRPDILSRESQAAPPIPPTPPYIFTSPHFPDQFNRNRCHNSYEFAIKPASHTTERHSSTCLMSRNRGDSSSAFHTPNPVEEIYKTPQTYSGFNSEMRQAIAHPPKLHDQIDDFESWHNKVDGNVEETTEEMCDEPSFRSTPRNKGKNAQSVSFIACSSTLEETGVKPKRSLKYTSIDASEAEPPGFFSR